MTTIDEAQRRALSAAPDDIPANLRVVWAWLVVFDAEIVLDEGYILDGDKWIPERASVLGIIERLRDGNHCDDLAACVVWIGKTKSINRNAKTTYDRLLELVRA